MSRDDEVKEAILQHLYTTYKEALSTNRARLNERQIVHALMDKYSREEIVSNLLHLLDIGWIKTQKVEKVSYYLVKDKGIKHFEASSSIFQKSNFLSGVNITNINGVTIVGNNNVVRQEFVELYKNLDILKEKIGESEVLSDTDKVDYKSDIETIKSQLAKQKPDKGIIKQAWSGLSAVATLEGVIQFYQAAEHFIKHIIS